MNADFRRDRTRLVEKLRGSGIHDLAVLHAFDAVPRHAFVPEVMQHRAYENGPLPIGDGQTISSPMVHAVSIQLAELKEGDHVLEVGTGSGFQTALLAELGTIVSSIERIEVLSVRAAKVLAELGYDAHLEVGDGGLGMPERAPFSAIIVGAAAAEPPGALFAQLTEGGRLIVPIGTRDQVLYRYVREGTGHTRERISSARFVPLIERSTP